MILLVAVPFYDWKKGSLMSHFVKPRFQESRPKRTLSGHPGSSQILGSNSLRKPGLLGQIDRFCVVYLENLN